MSRPRPGAGGYRRVVFYLGDADWQRLVRLADEEFRTPDVQAAYLLTRVLRARPEAAPAASAEAGDAR